MNNNPNFYSKYFTYIKPIAKMPIVKTYGSTIFTLIILTVFILYAIKPTVETILVLQKKLDDSNQVLSAVNKKVSDLSKAQQNYNNLDQTIKSKIELAIPDSVTLKTITQTLEQSAKNQQASISALQIQPLILQTKTNSQTGTLSEIGFTFNLEGDFQNLISLLQDLKTSDRLISIESISLSKLNEGSGLIMSLSGKAYYIK